MSTAEFYDKLTYLTHKDEWDAFYRHLNEHGCGAGDGPTYIGGYRNCPIAVSLEDPIREYMVFIA